MGFGLYLSLSASADVPLGLPRLVAQCRWVYPASSHSYLEADVPLGLPRFVALGLSPFFESM